MQRVVIIPETEFSSLVARLEKLEAQVQASASPQEDRVYTVREAAEQLNMTPEGIRVARRHKRLRGFKINEKCWGFHQSELDRYKNRYKRL
jgi:hypothetical protein